MEQHQSKQHSSKKKLMIRGKMVLFISLLVAAVFTVETAFSYISLSKAYEEAVAVARNGFDSVIKSETQSMVSLLQDNYQKYQEHLITEQQAAENAKRLIRTTRYGTDGYFEADLADGTCVAHMTQTYEGQKRLEFKDPVGNYYIKNIIAAGNHGDGGFSEYYFAKPGKSGLVFKRAFTLKFEPYGWYITTGVYEDDVDALVQTYAAERNRVLVWLIVCGLVVASLAVLFAMLFSDRISSNLRKVTERLRLLAEGDLHSPVPEVRSGDETGLVAQATVRMLAGLRTIVGDITGHLAQMSAGDLSGRVTSDYAEDLAPIRESMIHIQKSLNQSFFLFQQSAGQLSSSSNDVSGAAQALADGATEQAAAIEEVSQTVSEISGQVGSNASKAAQARELAVKAGAEVENGNRQMERMTEAMDGINSSTAKISEIIKVIDDIAFQTNILALNASVEAARAGDAGKGFTVVAEEVRSLAARSAEAAKNTTALIGASVAKAAEGKKIADSTADSLGEIDRSVGNVSALIHEIDVASSMQAKSISQVKEGIGQISQVMQTNSATAEESVALSRELSGQAEALQNEVGKFRLQGDVQTEPDGQTAET